MTNPEKNGSNPTVNVYADYFPRERIAELVDATLDEIMPINPEMGSVVRNATWTDQKNNRYSIQKTSKKTTFMGMNSYTYQAIISHVADGSPSGKTTNQYVLESNAEIPREYNYRPLRQTIKDGNHLGIPRTDDYIASDVLRILFEKAPDAAQRLLQERFDQVFSREMVGEYLLSRFAVVPDYNTSLTKITKKIVVETVSEFYTYINGIEYDEMCASVETNKNNPALHSAVLDAIESLPTDGRHGSKFIQPELAKAAIEVSSRLPHDKWNNVIVDKTKVKEEPADISKFITSPIASENSAEHTDDSTTINPDSDPKIDD